MMEIEESSKIKTILLLSLVVFLLILDLAALHDIFRGEPNLKKEYGMIGLSMIVFAVVIVIGLKRSFWQY